MNVRRGTGGGVPHLAVLSFVYHTVVKAIGNGLAAATLSGKRLHNNNNNNNNDDDDDDDDDDLTRYGAVQSATNKITKTQIQPYC